MFVSAKRVTILAGQLLSEIFFRFIASIMHFLSLSGVLRSKNVMRGCDFCCS
jgi:hypothetical protein